MTSSVPQGARVEAMLRLNIIPTCGPECPPASRTSSRRSRSLPMTTRFHDQQAGRTPHTDQGVGGGPPADTVLSVTALIDRPSTSRRVDLALSVPEGLDLLLTTVAEPVRLAGEITGVVEGVLFRGVLRADMRLQCARCLEDVAAQIAVDVVELFSDPLRVDRFGTGAQGEASRKLDVASALMVEEGYEITDGTIDLGTLVRDALVSSVPCQPLCDAACKGLCPMCGVNRNEVECVCQETTIDPRWAVLGNLRLKADGD
jgi:uncharacterized protein